MKITEITEAKVPFTKSKGQMVKTASDQAPLKNNDTIRVYHGFNDYADLVNALRNGISGKERIARRYSYEGNNNPSGLFVTIDLDVAKEFGSYIIEFQTKVDDLEAPQWPGGQFTSQGQNASYFNNDEEREQEKLRTRNRVSSTSKDDSITKSDKPELANTLFSFGESQALFTGSLNPNSIRAVWVSANPDLAKSTYTRYSRSDFIKKLSAKEVPARFGGTINPSEVKNQSNKLFLPRDTVTFKSFVDRLAAKYKHLDREEIEDMFLSKDDSFVNDYSERMLWPQQATAVKTEVKRIKQSAQQDLLQ